MQVTTHIVMISHELWPVIQSQPIDWLDDYFIAVIVSDFNWILLPSSFLSNSFICLASYQQKVDQLLTNNDL